MDFRFTKLHTSGSKYNMTVESASMASRATASIFGLDGANAGAFSAV